VEFGDIVTGTDDLGFKLRIHLKNKSFIDFYETSTLKTPRFSIHWEQRHLKKGFYRLDNTPDPKWKSVSTFPIHFHQKDKVIIPPFSTNGIEENFRKFMNWVKTKLE